MKYICWIFIIATCSTLALFGEIFSRWPKYVVYRVPQFCRIDGWVDILSIFWKARAFVLIYYILDRPHKSYKDRLLLICALFLNVCMRICTGLTSTVWLFLWRWCRARQSLRFFAEKELWAYIYQHRTKRIIVHGCAIYLNGRND